MKQYSRTIPITIVIISSVGLLTACGMVGAADTASTSDFDTDTMASTEIQDLGTEEYLITEISVAATDEEKKMKNILYLQEAIAGNIADAYPSIRDVDVTLTAKDSDATLTGTGETAQINICLDLEEELTKDSIDEIAETAARAVDSVADNVTIQDTDGNVLYIGSEAFPESDI